MELRFLTAGAALILAGCGGLSHPISNDGADKGNPLGINPGTNTLTVYVDNSSLTVGETATINGSLSGAALQNTGLFNTTSSDSSVATVGGSVIFARSVGMASINVSYGGYTAAAPIDIAVLPSASGVAAVVSDASAAAFVPPAVTIKSGFSVRFSITRGHNVVFDAAPGAPDGIPATASSATVEIPFPVAGTFAYHCAIHGESGVINVTP
jgi:plastocyanin